MNFRLSFQEPTFLLIETKQLSELVRRLSSLVGYISRDVLVCRDFIKKSVLTIPCFSVLERFIQFYFADGRALTRKIIVQ